MRREFGCDPVEARGVVFFLLCDLWFCLEFVYCREGLALVVDKKKAQIQGVGLVLAARDRRRRGEQLALLGPR